MTLKSGAKEVGLMNFYGTTVGYHFTPITVIGSGGLFESSGDVVKSYDSSKNNLYVTVQGTSKLNGMSVSILSYSINTSALSGIPIPAGFNITVASGTITINENAILSKGSVININEGAKVIIPSGKNLYVLDSNEDKQANGGTTDAVLDINGTVEVTGGFYTSTSGADIKSSQKIGKVDYKAQTGTNTSVKVRNGSSTSAAEVSIIPALLHNGPRHPESVGEYTPTEGSEEGTTFLYCGICDAWYDSQHPHNNSTTYTLTLDDRSDPEEEELWITETDLVNGELYSPGETFTVTSEMACVVAISYDEGDTYEELVVTELVDNGDGAKTATFTLPDDLDQDFQIGIILLGDANEDGDVDLNDCTRIVRWYVEAEGINNELSSLGELAADANKDGEVDLNDATRIVRWYVEAEGINNTLDWDTEA